MITNEPLVSVITGVYNGEKYLVECIESVLAQSYQNWEYILVNNCSTDRTREIAERYAGTDKRIRIYNCDEFVNAIQNHNRALLLISPDSKYCKVVCADDWLFSECISRLVEFAESNPSVGIIGSYQLSGGGTKWEVRGQGLSYSNRGIDGREICRWHLLGGPYVFGNPTSTLYRSEIVRGSDNFYPNLTPYADVSACYEYLKDSDFGFIHQVLSYERIHENAISTNCRRINTFQGEFLQNFVRYGPIYLTNQEFAQRLEAVLDDYYRMLAVGIVNLMTPEFFDYHRKNLRELGYSFYSVRLLKAVCCKVLQLLFSPKKMIQGVLRLTS